DGGHLRGGDAGAREQLEQRVDGGVRERARVIRLDRDAGGGQLPAAAQAVQRVGRQRRARERGDVALAAFECCVRGRQTFAGQLRRPQSALRGVTRVVRLR